MYLPPQTQTSHASGTSASSAESGDSAANIDARRATAFFLMHYHLSDTEKQALFAIFQVIGYHVMSYHTA